MTLVFSGEISNVCPLNCSSAATLGSWGLLVPGYSVPQWPPGVNSSVWWEGLGQAHLQVVDNVEQFERVVVNVEQFERYRKVKYKVHGPGGRRCV